MTRHVILLKLCPRFGANGNKFPLFKNEEITIVSSY